MDVHYFLCSGKSFSQHERDRLATEFTTREETTVREKTQNEKNKGLKNKKHHGPFNSYNINKEVLKNELGCMPSNRPISWTRLPEKINVTKIKQFAISNGISLETFSFDEYLRRVRR